MYIIHNIHLYSSDSEESLVTKIQNGMFPKENDVVFGRKGFGTRIMSGTKRFREILKEKFEAHRNADQDERRKIEKALILQLKNELPPKAKFLRCTPSPYLGVQHSYCPMNDKEIRKATGLAFNDMRKHQRRKEKKAAEKANSSILQSCHEPPAPHVVFPKTADTASAKSTPRDSTKRPIKDISNLEPQLKEPKASASKLQEPTADASSLVDEKSAKENSTKRPIEITFPYGACGLFFPRRNHY